MGKIFDWLKRIIGEKAVAILLADLLTLENIKKAIAEILDIAETLAKKTDTKIDDQIVAKLKEIAGIEPKQEQ